eukprot:1062797-Rhodomonas_salina.1
MAGAQRWLVGGVRVAEEVGFKEVEVVVEERLLGEGSFSEVQATTGRTRGTDTRDSLPVETAAAAATCRLATP